jgi:hypothetical protein
MDISLTTAGIGHDWLRSAALHGRPPPRPGQRPLFFYFCFFHSLFILLVFVFRLFLDIYIQLKAQSTFSTLKKDGLLKMKI